MNILLPIAGKSSRFPNVRPKWMLSHPNGNFMLVESIKNIARKGDNIYIIYLKEHEEKYSFKEGLARNIKDVLDMQAHMIELETPTEDQVETVCLGLKEIDEDISFLVKDCDNVFSFNRGLLTLQNHVMYASLEETKNTDPSSKSYVQLNEFNLVTNIVEKRVISDEFCCGGYYFGSSQEFLVACEGREKGGWFISDVIFKMALSGSSFGGIKCSGYIDWGTLKDWDNYKQQFQTLFIDLDGVLFENSAAYLKPYIGETQPIKENVDKVKELIGTGCVEVVITTARPEKYREITEKQLQNAGIKYKHIVMGLQHNKRTIINDFSNTNPYPSCEAINIHRNSKSLGDFLK